MELPFDPAIPLLGLYPKSPETPTQKNLCTPMFVAAQFTIAKYWKQPKCRSANEWIKKLWYIYTMEFYASQRKKELLSCNFSEFITSSNSFGVESLELLMYEVMSAANRDNFNYFFLT